MTKLLRIKQAVYQEMIDHLGAVHPVEGCGLLAGSENLVNVHYPITNRLNSSYEFEMDTKQQLEAMLHMDRSGKELLAIYHSHPFGPTEPSSTDVSRANYPDTVQIIISWNDRHVPSARGFLIDSGVITELILEID